MYRIRQGKPFEYGYNPITTIDDKEKNTMMDFGILRIGKGQTEVDSEKKERAFLLVQGEITFEWEGKRETIKRNSCFDEAPWVLHVPQGVEVKITGVGEDSEICVTKTINDTVFESKLYTDKECASEERGKGTMKETSTRIVRTVFDYSNAKYSNLVLGEVIDFPGKWSSYPPHHHPQPEIYFYKFYPENGYGFCQLGEDVVQVKNNDTVKIVDDLSHPQTTAPGYAMYYLWVIRHIDGNPYITPIFEPEHLWVTDKDAKIWPDK
ncbi:5-deoxy-glucuronate isomerase [Fonticella tunisiensis]|uniref:5-deoxy-glucuronate isomerase n=1 Tax=Fonticella tunisiensis TaxID=1096341 RepID=A0A4R7KM80_9CLOT|nr:5-deoxy-glucuronate isomerase [Fonticella tunisiensis]TDT56496.1 5-deoxy-glucuronate isomerase [Fonticella tunisiensis]